MNHLSPRTAHIPAFTLIEAIVAMVIIVVCFWLSSMIYINVVRADARAERLRAFTETKRIAVETKQRQTYYDEEIAIDSTLYIKKTIEMYQNAPELKILNVEAYNAKQRKMASYKQIVTAK